MDIANLLSGLLGALLGAALGVAGAFMIERWRTHQDEGGAARAVYLEVAANIALLELMAGGVVSAPIGEPPADSIPTRDLPFFSERSLSALATSTWPAERIRLSRALSPLDLVAVAAFYMRVEGLRRSGVRGSKGALTEDHAALRETITTGERATAVLESRGWSASERPAMRGALSEALHRAVRGGWLYW